MKKMYLSLLICCLFMVELHAQISLEKSSHALRDGDQHYFNMSGEKAPGPAGANQTWDFSNLDKTGQLTSHMFPILSDEKAGSFPQCNTVLEEFGNHFYFRVTDFMMEQYGTLTANGSLIAYDKPFIKMVFPFSYGDYYSGNYSGSIINKNNSTAIKGSYELEGDAFGTLILPGERKIENVLRIKTTRTQYYNNSSKPSIVISYKWYGSSLRYPLLSIIEFKNDQKTYAVKTAWYSGEIEKNTNEQRFEEAVFNAGKIKLYPNPVEDKFSVDLEVTQPGNLRLEIYDMQGKRFYQEVFRNKDKGFYSIPIDTEEINLPQGTYNLIIHSGKQKYMQHFLKL